MSSDQPPRSRRRIHAGAVAAALAAACFLTVPAAIRGHARAMRLDLAETHGELARRGGAPLRLHDNWVATRLSVAMGPLGADLGRRARAGRHPVPAVPPAHGVIELQQWLERELTDPLTEIRPMPAVASSHLQARRLELERIQDILLAGDPVLWGRTPSVGGADHVQDLLLASALESARNARFAESERSIRAAWRLALSSMRRRSTPGCTGAERVVVALRRLPDIPPEWIDRLDSGIVRSIHATEYAIKAERMLRLFEGYPQSLREVGAQTTFLMARTHHAREAWLEMGEARHAMTFAAELDDPERCGHPPRVERVSQRDPLPVARTMDRLIVQFELTRKVAMLHAARREDPDGAWPACVDGIEASECHGLAWRYEVSHGMLLEPQGPALAWLLGEHAPLALSVATR